MRYAPLMRKPNPTAKSGKRTRRPFQRSLFRSVDPQIVANEDQRGAGPNTWQTWSNQTKASAPPVAGTQLIEVEDRELEDEADEVADLIVASLTGSDDPHGGDVIDWQRELPNFARSRRAQHESANPFTSSGQPLPSQTRAQLEAALGLPLGHIRLHADNESADIARRTHARAFAVGNHIGFAVHEWAPGEQASVQLLAHEIAHALRASPTLTPPRTNNEDASEGPKAPHGQFHPGGRSLPKSLLDPLNSEFCFDLRQVRIHDHADTKDMLASLATRAAAVGTNIYFDADKVTLDSPDGLRLLRHELNHVQQYLFGELHRPGSALTVTDPKSEVEVQASASAAAPDAEARLREGAPPTPPTAPTVIAREGPNDKGSRGGVWEFLGATIFRPDEDLHNYINHQTHNQALIKVSFGPYARGTIVVERRAAFYESTLLPPQYVWGGYSDAFFTVDSDEKCTISFNHPDLPENSLGLRIEIVEGKIGGYVVFKDEAYKRSLGALYRMMTEGIPASIFGIDGIGNIRFSNMENEICHGELLFGLYDPTFETTPDADHPEATQPIVEGAGCEIGLDHLDFWATHMALDLVADGLAATSLPFTLTNDGSPFGTVTTEFDVAGIKGEAQATFVDGHLQATGSATVEKFQLREGVFVSGVLAASLTSRAETNETLMSILAPYVGEHNDVSIAPPSDEEASDLALIGWGELSFSFNDDTLYGSAVVILDSDHGLTAAGHFLSNLEVPLFKPPIEHSYVLMEPKGWSVDVVGIPWLVGVEAFLEAQAHAGYKVGPGKIHGFELKGIISSSEDIGRHFEVKGRMLIPGHAWVDVGLEIGLKATIGPDIEPLEIEVGRAGIKFNAVGYVPGLLQAELSTFMSSSSSDGSDKGGADESGDGVEVLGLGRDDMNTKLGFAGTLLCEGELILRLFGSASARIGRNRKSKEGKPKKAWKRWSLELFDKAYNLGGGRILVSASHVFGVGNSEDLGYAIQREWGSHVPKSPELTELAQTILRKDKERLLGEDSEEDRGYGSEEELEEKQQRVLGEDEGDEDDEDDEDDEGQLALSEANLDGRDVDYAGKPYFVFDALTRPTKKDGEPRHHLSLAVYPEARLLIESDTQRVIDYLDEKEKQARRALERIKANPQSANEAIESALQVIADLVFAKKIVGRLEGDARAAYILKRWAEEHRPSEEELAADRFFEGEDIDKYDRALRKLVAEFYPATDPVLFLAGFDNLARISQDYLTERDDFFEGTSDPASPYESDVAEEESQASSDDNVADGNRDNDPWLAPRELTEDISKFRKPIEKYSNWNGGIKTSTIYSIVEDPYGNIPSGVNVPEKDTWPFFVGSFAATGSLTPHAFGDQELSLHFKLVDFKERVRSNIRGRKAMDDIINHFEGRFAAVTGHWVTFMPSNLNMFNHYLRTGNLREAAAKTFTGSSALSHGYRHIRLNVVGASDLSSDKPQAAGVSGAKMREFLLSEAYEKMKTGGEGANMVSVYFYKDDHDNEDQAPLEPEYPEPSEPLVDLDSHDSDSEGIGEGIGEVVEDDSE